MRVDQLNEHTQPLPPKRVFTNPDVVAKGWYLALASRDLRRGEVRAVHIADQRLVIFRGHDGRARALDAFCAHMGTDLAIGRVVGDTLRCFFHHWQWDGDGRCARIPNGATPPARAAMRGYATDERYGFVWVWPDASAPAPVPDFPGWEGLDTVTVAGRPLVRACHHHVAMINGIDAQHLATVHGLNVRMDVSVDASSDGRVLDISLAGEIPADSWLTRLARAALGERYRYSMRYVDGTIGMLAILEDTRPFGRPFDGTHMIFAYTPLPGGGTRVQPIYVARAGRGVRQRLAALARVGVMARAYGLLRDDDGIIYDHIRFHPNALLDIDAPVARYVAWVNRLSPSAWSRDPEAARRPAAP